MNDYSDDSVLSGSLKGRDVFAHLIGHIGNEPTRPTALVLNFENVKVATASFLRESVLTLKTYTRIRESKFYPVVSNMNQEIEDELTIVVDALKDVIVSCKLDKNNKPTAMNLIGNLDSMQQGVFDFVCKHKNTNADSLSASLGTNESTKNSTVWNNRLAGLVALGVICETKVGRSKFYNSILEEYK